MLAATLLAAPARADLTEARVTALARDWGARGVDWLAPGVACDLLLDAPPPEGAGDALRAEGFDLAVQPAGGRRRKVLLADMDSTMIGQECIDELADLAGVGAEVARITALAMDGHLDFPGALRARVGLLAGLPVGVIAQVLEERITLAPGGPALVATMRAHGAWAALVSGGFTDFTAAIAARLGFDEHRANVLLARDGALTGEVAEPILGREAKLLALHEICAARGVAPGDVLAIGDGANDLAMIGAAGTGVALHAKPSVAAVAAFRLDHADLTGALYLQGYRASEIVGC